MLTRKGGPTVLGRKPTTSFLTAATSIYAIGAGITAAAGKILALQLILAKIYYFLLIPITRHGYPVLLLLLTTSLCQDWVICAPVTFLRSGSRFSGSLSESNTNSLSPVTAMVGHLPSKADRSET